VSGILSNTAERNPSAKVVTHEASGSSSTGIIDAHITRHNRKTVPLSEAGISPHGTGLRKAPIIIAIQTPSAGMS